MIYEGILRTIAWCARYERTAKTPHKDEQHETGWRKVHIQSRMGIDLRRERVLRRVQNN